MKKLIYYIIPFMIGSLSVASCLNEEFVPDPSVKSMSLYMPDINGRDSLVTEITHGFAVKFTIETEADVCSVWPGGIRTVMKRKGTTVDSLDMFNHPVLVKSDCYSDYGLVGARGYKGTQTGNGWYVSYTYPDAGDFELIIVLTNHGYDDTAYNQVIVPYGVINVK